MERVGSLFLAKSPYTVQVKSNPDPLVFEAHALQWVIEHPLPFFLCIVDKDSVRLSVYHTLPRFFARVSRREKIVMVPEPLIPGKETRLDNTATDTAEVSLGQPIIDFSVNQMLDDEFWAGLRIVFEGWVGLDNENLFRVKAKLPTCYAPVSYKTNEKMPSSGTTHIGILDLQPDRFHDAAVSVSEQLIWISEYLQVHGDVLGAAKAFLFLRHVYPHVVLPLLHNYLCDVLENGTLARIDERLAALVQTELPKEFQAGSDPGELQKG
jgi:hypothetical protein